MGFAIDEDAAYVTDDVRRHGTVTDLVVQEEWRGRGIGRMLLAEAERLTREAGARLVIGALVANDRRSAPTGPSGSSLTCRSSVKAIEGVSSAASSESGIGPAG